ncbi:serine hydrolase [Acidobacteriota bacterium]
MKRYLSKVWKVWIVIFLVVSLSYANEEIKTDQVDKLFVKWDSKTSPGAALAIIKDGKIIYKRGYGMANLEHNIPIQTTSVFRVGSTSKQFTAACIALLTLGGKISLDDNIRRYIPEIADYDSPIKVKHLVFHTSGLRDYTALMPLAGYRTDADSPTIDETIEMLSRQKSLNFKPGEMYSYSNSGYFLLSLIVERVSGQSLNDFAREHIFDPLGMQNTHFHDDFTQIVKKRADGYSPGKNGFRINMTNWDHVGDGGIYTNVKDFFKWDQAFYNQKLGKEFVELIRSPGTLNNGETLDYAFGLRLGHYRGLKTIGHGGSWVGFRSAVIRFPEQKFSVIILANLSTMNPSLLCLKVADIYLADFFTEKIEPTGKKLMQERAPVTLSAEELQTRAGNYYEEKSGMWMSVSIEVGKLKISVSNRVFLLKPVTKTSFLAEDSSYDIFLEFEPEEENAVQRAGLTMRGGEKVVLVRVPGKKPLSLSALKEYAGEYYCEELRTSYRLKVEKETLIFKHRNAPSNPLKAMAPDKFICRRWNINFTRLKSRDIKGFVLGTGRMLFEFVKE